jgi:dynein heavy chain
LFDPATPLSHRKELNEFLEDPDKKVLLAQTVDIKLTTHLDKLASKGKGVLLLKVVATGQPLNNDNIQNELIMHEIPNMEKITEQLEQLAKEVYLPILLNPMNQQGWGEVACTQMKEKIHRFISNVSITSGAIKGETTLPVPVFEIGNTIEENRKVVTLLEGALTTWTDQIVRVLKMEPEALLKQPGVYPTPDKELTFWAQKASHLNSISEQLESGPIRQVLKALDQLKSSYCPTFAKLLQEMFASRLEANDNEKYLRTLDDWFTQLNGWTQSIGGDTPFKSLFSLFRPMLHVILLIWKNSNHYCKAPRLTVLIREICNALINQCCLYVTAEELFKIIEDEDIPTQTAITMIQDCIEVCTQFKETYNTYKNTASNECPDNPWVMKQEAIFNRLTAYIDRMTDILDLAETILQFSELAKIEVGGTKGEALSASVAQIYTNFNSDVAKFQTVSYDIMDVSARDFDEDFYKFRGKVKELERQIAALILQSFDDSNNLMSRFKLLDSFEELTKRPLIQDELEQQNIQLVQMCAAEFKTVQEIFLADHACPPGCWQPTADGELRLVHAGNWCNLPATVSAVLWCRGLRDRITDPMQNLVALGKRIQLTNAYLKEGIEPIKDLMEREEAREVSKLYGTVINSLMEFETHKIEEWGRDVETLSQANLKKPLLTRAEQGSHLAVNFDPILVKLLREVKYYLLCKIPVPQSTLTIFERTEEFRVYRENLDIVVDMYNNMLDTRLPVEEPLVRAHFDKIDKICDASIKGPKALNWRSEGIKPFIDDSMEAVKFANSLLTTMKTNMGEVEEILQTFEKPMLEPQKKPVTMQDFDAQQKALLATFDKTIKDGANTVHKLVKNSNDTLKVGPSPDWKAYLEFLNNIVVSGLAGSVRISLEQLLTSLDQQEVTEGLDERSPMLEIMLDLNEKTAEVLYDPPIDMSHKNCLRNNVLGWVQGFYKTTTAFKRLEREGSYKREMNQDTTLRVLLSQINAKMAITEGACMEFRNKYTEYSHLWTTDLNKMFAEFVEDAKKTQQIGDSEEDTHELVDLAKFDAAIEMITETDAQIRAMKSPCDIGWLRVASDPVKEKLGMWCEKWKLKYTQFMGAHVEDSLRELDTFMESVNAGLDTEVIDAKGGGDEGDDEADASLKTVMTHIRDVRKKMGPPHLTDRWLIETAFEPLRDMLQLLKKHGEPLADIKIGNEDLQDYLESVPLKWEGVVGKMFKKKEEILPLQSQKVEVIKARVDKFVLSMREFRGQFREKAPFKFNGTPDEAYAIMEEHAGALMEKIAATAQINTEEELFELQVSKYPEISDTASELKILKSLWDYKANVFETFETWKRETWTGIDTEALEDANKLLQKNIKKLGADNPIAKGWQVYRDIEEMVKDMATVLPLVNELHSPAMRDRHWKKLAEVCNTPKIDPSDPKFCLKDLLDLKLHTHVEDAQEIVETANKELKIEKKLIIIEAAWSKIELDYVKWKESEIKVIRPSEEVVESLEANQLELQAMIGMGKFVDYFKDRVLKWQVTLGTVESVLKEWQTVSRMWGALESIFLASADIRSQLPDDTKRFEGIDSEFKDLMKETGGPVDSEPVVPSVVEACVADGREEILRAMVKKLELCQKSLNEYLDVKKKIFPRFYFVSTVALLEILSNGNNPPKIMPFVGDCFDAIKTLIINDQITTEGASGREAIAMQAKDGESIPFVEPFIMEGAVEIWLNNFTEKMRVCLRYQLNLAIIAGSNWDLATETPRHLWVFDYPAQVVLNGTQIYWTEETEQALEEFEGGQEDAIKKYLLVCNSRLDQLIKLVLGKLSSPDRTKIIALITMDVHGRDVVQKLIDLKIQGPLAFTWQMQLRFYFNSENQDVDIKITDFFGKYFYEYIGNTGRLVITPLTDRCYITLTMALRLYLGGAPAGPAGTGKTETTKDLARALAIPCYVFNCSDQMNFQTMADIFRGLCQSGSWGCFDEFNRIPIEVLSVVATQVKTIQDAIVLYAVPANREEEFQHHAKGTPPVKLGTFDFMGDPISLIPTCGFWITMNPGYAGRTELPENLKVLFRSCAMIKPDLIPICENMLMSEGFLTARHLAVKFFNLYQLSSELLSPQPHYDWGLRAVKSVLRVAGTMKRANPDLEEAKVLMRALRDFNTPKLPKNDEPIFMRLIDDLFMGIHVDRVINENLKQQTLRVTDEMGLQHDDQFILRVTQYQELIDVRHSVMLLGPAGCAKTEIWKVLQGTHNLKEDWKGSEPGECWKKKDTCVTEICNPKAVTSDELYGYMTLAKDWKDGCLSIVMRGMAKCYPEQGMHEYQTYKWVILDGDIDAVWIESMNTVMDDNKVLTLVSNERIPLSAAMRMIFEINSLKNATPATVSRAGILYINESDIGWRPFVESWLARREDEKEAAFMSPLFEKYIEATAELIRKGFKDATPIRLICRVMSICYLMESLLKPIPDAKKTQEVVESYFVFALTWSFGGPLVVDKGGDYRKNFHEAFIAANPNLKYPKEGLCFDYCFNHESGEFERWTVPEYRPMAIGSGSNEVTFSNLVVDTADSVRLTFLLNSYVQRKRGVMFVGGAGTGKTTIMKSYLKNTGDETLLSNVINMNYYTDSLTLQGQLEAQIDKRSGRMFGPPTGKKLIYFLDDLNLPYIEEYGTQNSHALLVQQMDHGTIFDRVDLGLRKEIVDVQYIAAMNPTAGSFIINERNQRHFATFAAAMPGETDLTQIYGSILSGHLMGFDKRVVALADRITTASIALHSQISSKFLPSATKFVYNWNMRELTNIYQGLCLSTSSGYSEVSTFTRLWAHECERVFMDRMINEQEQEKYKVIFAEILKKPFECEDIPGILEPRSTDGERILPNILTNFAVGNDHDYLPVGELENLSTVLQAQLTEYNESNPMMDLVLFDDAMAHICRINRIISNPAGNAMLIGVGGSGKQSLSKLAAFIGGMEVKQLQVTSNFKVEDLKEALQEIYKQAGVKGIPMIFLMTDQQIVNDKFLVYINNMLASGWIPDLFARDDIDALLSAIRNEAKAAGIIDTPDAMLEFLISRIRRFMHVVLCFSPVGEVFRVRARRFPGLINCTAIDWFHSWPKDALESVASKFLANLGDIEEKTRGDISVHMAMVHLSVIDLSTVYLKTQRRYNYTTPKSFLELIAFYTMLLGQKQGEVQRLIDRLDVGLSTLRKVGADVAELEVDLKLTMVKVAEKVASTDILIADMGVQREKADIQKAEATIEEEKSTKLAADSKAIVDEANREVAAAMPAMEAAASAVDALDKAMLTEYKGFKQLNPAVQLVNKSLLMMIRGARTEKQCTWDLGKKMMGDIGGFINELKSYNGKLFRVNGDEGTECDEALVKTIGEIREDPEFELGGMMKKSKAAGNLCNWVHNIHNYNRIYVKVEPLVLAKEAAEAEMAAAEDKLKKVRAAVAAVEILLAELQATFTKATEEKAAVEAEAEACNVRIGLAGRLVGGLASENARWAKDIEQLKFDSVTLTGDCLLAAAFVSYAGAFDWDNRNLLWKDTWKPDLVAKGIPMSNPETVDPLDSLTNDGNNAQMMSEGLPSDRISIENGSIITNSKRWPLMIDPQLQGIKWLREKEKDNNLMVLQLTMARWLNNLENAITNGFCIIFENLGEDIDATLDPVLARAVYRKGRNLYLKLAGEEVEYDQKFQLYLQTKLSNPHYKPEIQAQCTMVNFIATEAGLEDQLLAKVVKKEKPEMEQQKQDLVANFQRFKIQLVELEDGLLEKLANAPDDILSDVPLIESLEETKKTKTAIDIAVEEGKKTEIAINAARESYRIVAAEGAMLYFMLTGLNQISHMYQYSLDSYIQFFFKAIADSEAKPSESERVLELRSCLRFTIYTWVSRGLQEEHKIIILTTLTFNLIKRGIIKNYMDGPAKDLAVEDIVDSDGVFADGKFQFLLRGLKVISEDLPVSDWLPNAQWFACKALSNLPDMESFSADLAESPARFREWYNHVTPETEKLPLNYGAFEKKPFNKLCIIRTLRPDRMTVAVTKFVRDTLPKGPDFVECDGSLNSKQILDQSLGDSTPVTPLFFVLTKGADVVGDLDTLTDKYEIVKGESYHNVSMGQGQDVVAMEKLEQAHRNGHWVILNNIHLMPSWLIELEKKLDEFALEGSHARFRLFLTSDPSNGIPIGLLARSIKLTNAPPQGLKANLKRAFSSFSKEYIDECDSKMRSIVFGLCHFHAIMMERKSFGPLGYNMQYPFSLGDLRDSTTCLNNYMEVNAGGKIPWADLRYIFGEIMYGGHIVNEFDRKMCACYLDYFMKDELLEETEMYPYNEDSKASFKSPLPTTFDRYLVHIDTEITSESPVAFGFDPNAEIDFRTTQSENMFATILELQPKDAGSSDDASQSPQAIAENVLTEIMDKFAEKVYDLEDIVRTLEEQGPYQNVFVQEIELISVLMTEMKRSLRELRLGFNGELTMSPMMETLMDCLYMDKIPATWAKKSWPSMRSLTLWIADILQRLAQLDEWVGNPMEIPKVTWLSGLINPQSFLTAIMQVTAQTQEKELDKLCVVTEVKKVFTPAEIEGHSRDGAYISGLAMQGARWEVGGGQIEPSKPKEMSFLMPIINCKAVSVEKQPKGDTVYLCPTYKTEQRGPTYVFQAQLKTKHKPDKWCLAGVAMIMDLVG